MEEMKDLKEQNEKNGKKRLSPLLILIPAGVLLVGAIVLVIVLRSGKSGSLTPEKAAEAALDTSIRKDWKTLVDCMRDEELEMLLKMDSKQAEENGIGSAKELRKWALEHVSDIPDPMNGSTVKSYQIIGVKTMAPDKYIREVLDGESDENAFYTFLNNAEEISEVDVECVIVKDGEETKGYQNVTAYKKDGHWFTTAGVQMVDSMLRKD